MRASQSTPRAFDPDNPDTWPMLLNVPEMAAILRSSEKQVRLRARARRIPGAVRQGRFWRFKRPAVQRWLSKD